MPFRALSLKNLRSSMVTSHKIIHSHCPFKMTSVLSPIARVYLRKYPPPPPPTHTGGISTDVIRGKYEKQ
jgi:hypothetical protein